MPENQFADSQSSLLDVTRRIFTETAEQLEAQHVECLTVLVWGGGVNRTNDCQGQQVEVLGSKLAHSFMNRRRDVIRDFTNHIDQCCHRRDKIEVGAAAENSMKKEDEFKNDNSSTKLEDSKMITVLQKNSQMDSYHEVKNHIVSTRNTHNITYVSSTEDRCSADSMTSVQDIPRHIYDTLTSTLERDRNFSVLSTDVSNNNSYMTYLQGTENINDKSLSKSTQNVANIYVKAEDTQNINHDTLNESHPKMPNLPIFTSSEASFSNSNESFKSGLKDNLINNTGESECVNKESDKTCNQSADLNCLDTARKGEKPYVCEKCSKGFSAMAQLKVHMLIHSDKKPYVCKECHKGFCQYSHLKTHMRSHTGERPYVCQQCNRGFTQMCVLKAHLMMHSGERPHVCEKCDKGFISLSHLNQHQQRIHDKMKPHVCTDCNKGFFRLSDLKLHLMTHKKEKPHVCRKCRKEFNKAADLAEHMLSHPGKRIHVCQKCKNSPKQHS